MSRTAIEATFGAIRSDLIEILERKDARQRQLQSQINATEDETRRRGNDLDELTTTLNLKVKQREELEARVAETLSRNKDFQERSKLAIEAEERLHKNEGRVQEIERDASEKLPHYQKSRLFTYLYKRRFGTKDYKAASWVEEIDGWVAKLIDFGNAKIGYEYLEKTPLMVAEEVARRREQFNQLMQQVEAIQHAEAKKAGLSSVLEEGNALGDKRDLLVQEIERLRQTSQSLQQELAKLAQTQNEFYTEALARFESFLGETKLAVLSQRARETPGAEDDAIVRELAEFNRKNDELTRQMDDLSRSRREADRLQEGLDLVAQRYRQANFDSERSYFSDGFDLSAPLERYRAGGSDADNLWRAIQSAQQFRPHWVEATSSQAGQVIASPSGRVILGAILDVATAAMQNAAMRGVQRRDSGGGFGSFPSFPTSFPESQPSSAPPTPDYSPTSSSGGFTTEDGF